MGMAADHIRAMSHTARMIACALCLCAAPLAAQDKEALSERKEFDFEKFADAAREALDQLTEQILPLLEELGEKVGELSEYHAPEVLPNGDIIIRRKTPEELAPDEEGETLDL